MCLLQAKDRTSGGVSRGRPHHRSLGGRGHFLAGWGTPRTGARPQDYPSLGLTWAVGGLLGSHLHEESHLLALGEGVAGSDPGQPHAKQQSGLPGDRLLLDPLPLRTLLLCEAVETGESSCRPVLRTRASPGAAEPLPPTAQLAGNGQEQRGRLRAARPSPPAGTETVSTPHDRPPKPLCLGPHRPSAALSCLPHGPLRARRWDGPSPVSRSTQCRYKRQTQFRNT